MKSTFTDILDDVKKSREKKLRSKIPFWAAAGEIIIPSDLNLEQCSSETTALYKASVAARLAPAGSALADLTGGLGVDCWAFSRRFPSVIYNDMNPDLVRAASPNFTLLGMDNVTILPPSPAEDALGRIGETGLIFLDPGRRDAAGKKVFLVEDCRPDVLSMKENLLEKAPAVMVKLSPMADLTMLRERFGQELTHIHVVGAGGECKELLAVLQRGGNGLEGITVAEVGEETRTLSFLPEDGTPAPLAECRPEEGQCLFEPSASLMKAGKWGQLCLMAGMRKAGRFTHLLLCDAPVKELEAFGQFHTVKEVRPLSASVLKGIRRDFPRCEFTARNIPMTSEEMRKRCGCAPGGTVRIFGITADYTGGESEKLLLIV